MADHTSFRLYDTNQEGLMLSDIVVGLSCKWERKSVVVENFPTGQEYRGELLSRELKTFKEVMKNGHQGERTLGLAPPEQHCQCCFIMLCWKCIVHDTLYS